MHNSVVFLIFVCSLFRYSVSTFCDYRIISTSPGDVVLTASSEFGAPIKTQIHGASRGVLNYTQFTSADGKTYHGAWTAAVNNDKQYIQIQLKKDYKITGVITQGRNGCCQQWVTKYEVFYGQDCNSFKLLDSGNGSIFKGNTDEDTMVTNMFPIPVTAGCVRIVPKEWNGQISMRCDIIGCQALTTPSTTTISSTTVVTSTTPKTTTSSNRPIIQKTFLPGACSSNLLAGNTNTTSTITASSIKDKGSVLVSYDPKKAFLFSKEDTNHSQTRYMGGWSPSTSDKNPFIQVEFADPTVVRGIVTQGKNGCCDKWVKKYKVFYSADCKTWTASGGGAGQIFSANTDKDTPKIQILFCPRAVKCIRIQPTEWNNEIGMRFELVGCPIAKGGVPGLNVSYNNQVNHATQPLLTSPPTTPSTTAKHVSGASTGQNCNQSLFAHLPYKSSKIVMTSSTELKQSDPSHDYSADRGRLHATDTLGVNKQLHGGWSAATLDTNQFLQVKLPHISTVTGIITQGKDGPGKEWVTKYRVLYSDDCKQWHMVNPVGGGSFRGNSDESTEVLNMFSREVQALCIKINPSVWNNHISLRMDLIGCFSLNSHMPSVSNLAIPTTQAFKNPTLPASTVSKSASSTKQQVSYCHNSLINNKTLGSEVNLTASSTFHNPTIQSMPERALLDTSKIFLQQGTMLGGWSPAGNGQNYIQASFSDVQMIQSVITQGMDKSLQWVTKFSIYYSEDCINWQQLRNPKEFQANNDDNTKVHNKLGCPIFAKCIRIYPTGFHNYTGLRFDLIGCNIKDNKNSAIGLKNPSTTVPTLSSVSTTQNSISSTISPSPSPISVSTKTTQATSSVPFSPTKSTPKTSMTSSIVTSSTTKATKFFTSTVTTPSSTISVTTPTTPKTTLSTTKTPTHITHNVLPTGKASNYNSKDPIDCKRALLMFTCLHPIVRRHCFYSCNPKQAVISAIFSSTSSPVSASSSITQSRGQVNSVHYSSAMSLASSQTPSIVSSVLTQYSPLVSSQQLVIQSHTSHGFSTPLSPSYSTIAMKSYSPSQSTSLPVKPSASAPTTHQSTITLSATPSSLIQTSSSIPSMTSSTMIVTTPLHHSHIVLPTGQASIYSPLDPLDCKRSLLKFSCSLSIIAKHCPNSCSKSSSIVISYSPSSSVVASAQSSKPTNSISNVASSSSIHTSSKPFNSISSSLFVPVPTSSLYTSNMLSRSVFSTNIKSGSPYFTQTHPLSSSSTFSAQLLYMSSDRLSRLTAQTLTSNTNIPSLSINSISTLNQQLSSTKPLISQFFSSSPHQNTALYSRQAASQLSNVPIISSSSNAQPKSSHISLSTVLSTNGPGSILSSISKPLSSLAQLKGISVSYSLNSLPIQTTVSSSSVSSNVISSSLSKPRLPSFSFTSSNVQSVSSILSSSQVASTNSLPPTTFGVPSSLSNLLLSKNIQTSQVASSMSSSSYSQRNLITSTTLSTQSGVLGSQSFHGISQISGLASPSSSASVSTLVSVSSDIISSLLNSYSNILPSYAVSTNSVSASTINTPYINTRSSKSSLVSDLSSPLISNLSTLHSIAPSTYPTLSPSGKNQPFFSSSANGMLSSPSIKPSTSSQIQNVQSSIFSSLIPSSDAMNSAISPHFSQSSVILQSSNPSTSLLSLSSVISTTNLISNFQLPTTLYSYTSAPSTSSTSSSGMNSKLLSSSFFSLVSSSSVHSSMQMHVSSMQKISIKPLFNSAVATTQVSTDISPSTTATPFPSILTTQLSNVISSKPSLLPIALSTDSYISLYPSLQPSQNLYLSSAQPGISSLFSSLTNPSQFPYTLSFSSHLVSHSAPPSSHSSSISIASNSLLTPPSKSSFSHPLSTGIPSSTDSLTSLYGSILSTKPAAYASTPQHIPLSAAVQQPSGQLSVTCVPISSMYATPSRSLMTDSLLLMGISSASMSMSIVQTPSSNVQFQTNSPSVSGISSTMLGSSLIIASSCYTFTVFPTSGVNVYLNSSQTLLTSALPTSFTSANQMSTSVGNLVSSPFPTRQVTSMQTSSLPSQTTTTRLPVTHVVIPTGVAGIYDNRDPVDCRRSLTMFSCTNPIVARHCHYSCASHPASRPDIFAVPRGSSAGKANRDLVNG